MRSGSAICSASRVGAFIALASADGHDDFEGVALGESRVRILASRYDRPVLFNGHLLSSELERFEETRDVRARLQTPCLTVYGKLNHVETQGQAGRIILPRGYRSKLRRMFPLRNRLIFPGKNFILFFRRPGSAGRAAGLTTTPIAMLSHNFSEVKKLRSAGNFASALPLVNSSKIVSDEDAFEAMICLFVSGNLEAVLGQVGRHEWKSKWSRNASQALVGLIAHKDTREALSLARSAVSESGIPYDAVALYLILLHANRLIDEAQAYIRARLQAPPPDEVLLHIVMAEIAAPRGKSAGAYSLALSVLSRDMNNFRALVISSLASHDLNNIHESLGYAIRAHRIAPGVPAVTLQLMRCQNTIGDHYAAIAAFNGLGGAANVPAEFHAELGVAYSGLGDRVMLLGLDCLKRGGLNGSFVMFRKSFSLVKTVESLPGWPVSEARIRHD